MLAHILALTVGLLSFALYMSAFFFPEVYRKSDLTWSGIGLFYALVLWVCAGRITGGVLLGQMASVALLGWLGWQTINLRRELSPIALRTPLPNEAKTIAQATQFKLGELRSRWQQTQLAEQTNRLAGTIAGWTSSIAKPKKQPPAVGGRSRQPKQKIAPANRGESVVSEATASEAIAADPGVSESTVSDTADSIGVAPARAARASRNPFDKLRRNPAKEATQKRIAPPAPSPSLDDLDLEDWDEEETIEEVMLEAETSSPEEAVVVIEAGDVAEADATLVVEVIEVEAIEPMASGEAPAPDADTNWADEPTPDDAIVVEAETAIEPPAAESASAAPSPEPPADQP